MKGLNSKREYKFRETIGKFSVTHLKNSKVTASRLRRSFSTFSMKTLPLS